MTKVHDNATDLITFARSSSGTALRRVGYGDDLAITFSKTGDNGTNTVTLYDDGYDINQVDASSIAKAYINGTFEANKTYVLAGDYTVSSGSFKIDHSNLAGGAITVSGHTVFRPLTAVTSIGIYRNAIPSAATFRNISVKEVIFDRATDDLVLFNHPDDIPRIEYAADGSLKGLLIEEQRTNLVTHSEDFSNAAWSKFNSIAVSPSAETAPNGQEVAYELTGIESGDGDTGLDEAVSASASTTYTGTIWFKAKSASDVGKYVRLRLKRIGGTFVEQNESVQLTNNWVRHEITLTLLSDNTGISLIITKDTTQNIVDRADECLIYGAQLEEGSFATSYIPTSGSQQTRSADVASIPVSAFGYNQEAGTVVVDFATLATFGSRDGNDGVFSLRDNSTDGDDLVQAFITPTDNLKAQVISGGSSLFSTIILANLPEQTQTKTAVGFTGGSYAASVDGGAAQSLSTSTTYPVAGEITELAIGEINNNGTKHLNGHIKSLSYFPRRLTDVQLQELTS